MKYSLPIIAFGLLLISSSAIAQELPPLEPVKLSDFANAEPKQCQFRVAELSSIHQKTPADQLIIVIARLGIGETKPNLNWRRLHNIRVYWSEYLPKPYRRNPDTILLAEGERVKELGHLEFYVGGQLVWVMKVARNADLTIGDCYPDEDRCLTTDRNLYPCLDRYVQRRKRR